ncbi:MAG: response regulator [Candidatus Cloacimonetes bacterium]|nr:response regulator [Candidatus Cloacimonadota bacterium]
MHSNTNEKFRILIVDDNPSIHEDYQKILAPQKLSEDQFHELSMKLFDDEILQTNQELSLTLDFAFQGNEAFEMVQKAYSENSPYILIFMDIRMPPGADGIETVRKIWELYPDQEVVICTAFTDYSWTDIQDKLHLKNKFLVLKKPFDAIEVKQIASSLIAKNKLSQQNKQVLNDLQAEKQKVEIAYQKLINESERRQFIEQQLVQAQKMEVVGRLAGGLAHDFNNILSCIVGTLQLIQIRFRQENIDIEKDPKLKGLTTIFDSTHRAQDLIQQLMSISEKQNIELVDTNLSDSIQQVSKILQSTLGSSIELNILQTEKRMALADPAQIQQVLLNMALNAKDAMPNGGTLSFDVQSYSPTEDFLAKYSNASKTGLQKLIVRDTGTGIPQDIISKIFDPFFSTKALGKGTGLGLSMCFQIIKQHHGFIEVFSEQNFGTMFCIYLPSVQNPEPQINSTSQKLEPGQGTVLVIDDEEILRIVTKGILESHGYQAILCSNGQEGIEQYKKYKDDVSIILLDLNMPNMNGNEVYLELMRLNCDIPILISSGYKEDPNLTDLLSKNNCTFIQKPYTLHQLIHTIQATQNQSTSVNKSPSLAHKILLADDEEVLNFAVSEHLSQLGYRVTSVSSGDEAWKCFQEESDDPYDLVITDLLMPGISGMQLAKSIRQVNKSIPIVIISVKTDKDIVKEAMRNNINDFLDKPTSLSEIQNTVNRLLSNNSPSSNH